MKNTILSLVAVALLAAVGFVDAAESRNPSHIYREAIAQVKESYNNAAELARAGNFDAANKELDRALAAYQEMAQVRGVQTGYKIQLADWAEKLENLRTDLNEAAKGATSALMTPRASAPYSSTSATTSTSSTPAPLGLPAPSTSTATTRAPLGLPAPASATTSTASTPASATTSTARASALTPAEEILVNSWRGGIDRIPASDEVILRGLNQRRRGTALPQLRMSDLPPLPPRR